MNYPLPQPGYGQPPAPPVDPYAQQPPQQPYAPSYPQAPAPAPGYPAAPQYGYPPAPPYPPVAAPVVNATIADFYNQPSSGSGPGLSWTTKQGAERPIGSWFAGIVVRDVTDGDIAQQTSPQGIPQTFRDGRPKLQMKVALKSLQTSDGGVDFPEGEGTWYVRGQARDELTRAMAEAGVVGTPKSGAYVVVTLVQRRPNPGFRPTNIVQVSYTPLNGSEAQAPVQQPQQVAPAPVVAPVAPPAPPVAPPPAPAAPAAVTPPPAPAPQAAPAAPAPPQAPVVYQQAAAPQPPAGLDPNAAAILQQLTAQQQPVPAQG